MILALVTVELRNLLKTNFELFDFDYTFDDKVFKKELEDSVIDFYYFSEIGQETPERFKHIFKAKYKRMMDYYNELYNTTLLKYNPLTNHNIHEKLEQLRETEGTEDTKGNTTGNEDTTRVYNENGKHNTDFHSNEGIKANTVTDEKTDNANTRTDNLKHTDNTDKTVSDYPQQSISTANYLSGAEKVDNNGTNTGTVKDDFTGTNNTNTVGTTDTEYTSSEKGTDNTDGKETTKTDTTQDTTGNKQTTGQENMEYKKLVEGITGTTYQKLVKEERENILRIKDMVIDELRDCFIMVY